MGKKHLLSETINACRLTGFIRFLRGLLIDDIRIIAYHRICDIDNLNDRELVSATSEVFEKQILYIKKHFNAITFEQLIEHLNNNTKIPDNSIIITFDDGFADNYHNAFPILAKHKVPATFFISSGYIGTKKTFWFNEISRRIKSNPGLTFSIDDVTFKIPDKMELQEELIGDILGLLKKFKNKKRLKIINDISEVLLDKEPCDQLALPMTWEQIKEMIASGIEFGSHTVTHPILSMLSSDELHAEIFSSKKEIEKNTGQSITTISYPEGMNYAFNSNVLSLVEKAGYKIGCSYIPGINKITLKQPFQLKRLHIERYVDFNMFKSMLSLPELFAS